MTTTQTMTDTAMVSDTQESEMNHSQMNMDPAQPFDAQLIDSMVEHHQGAIEMAQMAQHMAEHQGIKDSSDAIITAQQAEIEQLQS